MYPLHFHSLTLYEVKAKKTQTQTQTHTCPLSNSLSPLPCTTFSIFPNTMETQTLSSEKPIIEYHSTVDTSRPFRSVKEAVAILDERLLTGEIFYSSPKTAGEIFYSPKPYTASPKQQTSYIWKVSPSPKKSRDDDQQNNVVDTLKKLEAELEETKVELKLLKERESETEVALASLNAELHKNMSKMAEAEAAAAAKAVAKRSAVYGGANGEYGVREEKRGRDLMVRMENSPTLAQILSSGETEDYFGGRKERKMMKKKPIIPLVGDLFSRKKGSSIN
ncbi:hypothetical protein L1049_014977 [Liquidambar formosana]|uniref:WEB family protein n=1 Tax=Liquidambar formosana TaxID=63359 RepID=A0AAP0RWX1_LIQFO